MPLQPGTTLGSYSVTAKIGEGGMGEVYRARDTTLDRDVAIKVLSDAFTSDPERLARFEREAKVLASLNHPNIGAIYGLETSGDTRALVLELVEGPTLADRIRQGPIPFDEALPIAKQIAEALEAAHEAGVIHRDLKPANIKVRDDGTVKVLDFGLAKAVTGDGTASDGSDSPTMTAMATATGIIMGTAAYMSPEQARGKAVDRRTDVWAFGTVLYEMLTGQRAFAADDLSATLVAVLTTDVDLDVLPAETPPRLRRVLATCLQKDPRQRVRDIADVRLAMEGAFETTVGTPSDGVDVPTRQLWQRPIPQVLTALGLVVLTGLAVWSARQPTDPPAESVRRFAFDIGPAQPIVPANTHAMLAWSPDGTRLVYAANLTGRSQQLYVQDLDDLEARPLDGTENAYEPFFSPDGEWVVGFFTPTSMTTGELKRVAVGGGTPLTLCECHPPAGATWLEDGTIILTHVAADGAGQTVHRLPEAGGTPELLTTPDAERGERTGEQHVVIEGGFNARYVPTGHLVFARDGALWGVPFDLDRLATTGPEEVVLQGIEVSQVSGGMALSVAGDGTLAYWPGDAVRYMVPGGGAGGGGPVWVDRDGQATPIGADRRDVLFPRLSPDNTRLAVMVVSPDGRSQDIWVDDLERGTSTRLTNDGTSVFPAWSLDG